jgi:MerR family transcriptional regulator/heat shock protein HspR
LYSAKDILRLREVARLSAAGVTLTGIVRIMDLEHQLEIALREVSELRAQIGPSTALVFWRENRR